MQDKPYDEIHYIPDKGYDPLLDYYHNTRHASQRHAFLTDKQGWHLRSPWLSRFDWILDTHLEADFRQSDNLFLTKQRQTPRTVFVRIDLLNLFFQHVLPEINSPIVLYLGNAEISLSACGIEINKLIRHPLVYHIFAENKDLDIDDITAMPIGMHPREMLQANSVLQLQQIAGSVNTDQKIEKVFGAWSEKKSLANKQNEREIAKKYLRDHAAFCVYFEFLPLQNFWQTASEYRFMLAPWSHVHDSAKILEALIVKTIPIIMAGTYTQAYEGLPVVVVQDLNEINPKNLQHWWQSLSPQFEDCSFVHADYWWHKIEQALPVKKKAFLVLGPESHGNHLVTDILVHAGCHGHSGDHANWDKQWQAGVHNDNQPWDHALPTDEDPIVWRRSVPHLKNMPDIKNMVDSLEARQYEVTGIVITREPYAALQSQLKWHHVKNLATGITNIEKAYKYIFSQLEKANIHFVMTSYEALVNYPEAQDLLLQQLTLELPETRLPVWDGNKKWYVSEGQTVNYEKSISKNSLSDFPETWFSCYTQNYQQRIIRGKQRMQNSRVVFCGLARDVASDLPSVSQRIESAAAMFNDYRVVIYENDSNDGTLEFLQGWQQQNSRVTVLHEKLNVQRWGSVCDLGRAAHLAYCRNQYLKHIAAHFPDFDYFIVFDTDMPKGFSYEGLANTFGFDDWDMVGSNGILVPPVGKPPPDPIFFDAWAYRAEGDDKTQPFDAINRLQFHRGEALHPVWSCFGGLAIYRMTCALSGAQYGGEDCEHVVFHQQLRQYELGRQFLNPSQIVFYTGIQ